MPLQRQTYELYRRDNAYENPMSLVRLEATLQSKCGSQGHVRAHKN